MSDKKKVKLEVYEGTVNEIVRIYDYLKDHDVNVTSADIVEAAIKLAKRLGAGYWTFVCELQERDMEKIHIKFNDR